MRFFVISLLVTIVLASTNNNNNNNQGQPNGQTTGQTSGQSSGQGNGMDGVHQMLQQILTHYQQRLQTMQPQQQPMNSMQSQPQQQQQGHEQNNLMEGMNDQTQPMQQNAMQAQMGTDSSQQQFNQLGETQQNQLMGGQQSNPLLNQQQPNGAQGQQEFNGLQGQQEFNGLQGQQQQLNGMQGQQQQIPAGNESYQSLLRFLQELNNFNLKMSNNQMVNPTPTSGNAVSTSVFPVTPASGPVVTVTQTVHVQKPGSGRFSEALLDYLRSHVKELKGDLGDFLRHIIARHDAKMEKLKTRLCSQQPTSSNDWGEKDANVSPTPTLQTPMQSQDIRNQQQTAFGFNIPSQSQSSDQNQLWGATSTTKSWSTSFNY